MLRELVPMLSDDKLTGGKDTRDATGIMLARLLKSCPVCQGAFSNHSYALFATALLGEGRTPSLVAFLKALKEHRWSDAQSFQDWDSESDGLEAYAVRCSTGQIGLVTIRSPQEFYDSDQLVDIDVVTPDASRDLQDRIGESWRRIET